MSLPRSYLSLRRLRRNQFLPRETIELLQVQKLQRLVNHAYASVPFYRELFDAAGIAPADIRQLSDLQHLPIVHKEDLLAAGPESCISRRFTPSRLRTTRTGGSTGEPMEIFYDRRFLNIRTALMARALEAMGYRLGERIALILSTTPRPETRWINRRYLYIGAEPEELLQEVEAFRPRVLCGCLTPLRQMAVKVLEEGSTLSLDIRSVIPTAETLDGATRQLLAEAFQAPVLDLYGISEMGMVAWECPDGGGYHFCEDTVLLEALGGDGDGPPHLVMTNLELQAMPFIRYHTGDLGVLGDSEPCPCGRTLLRLVRIEGRTVDMLQGADGRQVSPYHITLAVEAAGPVPRYRVVQQPDGSIQVKVQGCISEEVEARIMASIQGLMGPGVSVGLFQNINIDPPPGRKFRVVERLG